MPVVVSVISASSFAVALVFVAGRLAGPDPAWTGSDRSQRWLVDHAARLPRTRNVIDVLDRRLWGGAMVAIACAAVLASSAFVGWVLATVDDGAGFARFDESTAAWGSAHATDASTQVLSAITRLGETSPLLIVMTGIGLVHVWHLRSGWGVLGFLLTVGIGVALINNALKWAIMRDRPAVDHLVGSGGSSFPSGHSAAAAACWAAIALVASRRMPACRRRWAAAAAAALAVLVAASRVMLGVHWLTDVIAGVVVGWTWFFVVALLFGGRSQRLGEPAEHVAPPTSASPLGALERSGTLRSRGEIEKSTHETQKESS